MINKDTQLCISIAEHASNFGTTLHNAAFKALNLNFIYKAFEVSDLVGAIASVRTLGIRGCSVSMPFKEKVIPLLDWIDPIALEIGSVNTIVNEFGLLKGYNTDIDGALQSLNSIHVGARERILLLGSGGVAKSIIYSLKKIGVKKIQVATRNINKIEALNFILPCEAIAWEKRNDSKASVLINATPIGMTPKNNELPVKKIFLDHVRAVMDVVVTPMESNLIKISRNMGKDIAPGYYMSLEQAKTQFKLYTGILPPGKLMEEKLKLLLTDD